MHGVDPYIIVHKIKNYPMERPIQQKLCQLHPWKVAAIQAEAEKIAKQFSANQGGGEVRIHRKNGGTIRDSDTVAPGNDPSSIKDLKH